MNITLIAIGLVLALLAIFILHWTTAVISIQFFALFLAYTACVYPGAALSDGRRFWMRIEVLVSMIFLACACLAVWQSSRWLVGGYFLHGMWDWGHHTKRIETRVVSWFPPICAAFDLCVAIFIAVRY
ncbi:MAG: DUF6010 family protein [bacterium]